MLKHTKCRSELRMNLSEMYILASPSMVISTKGITPGMIQIESTGRKSSLVLTCVECTHSISGKDSLEAEVVGECGVCHKEFSPSKLVVTDYITLVCQDCLAIARNSSYDLSTTAGKYLALYGGVLQSGNHPSLLTVLLKKN